MRVLAEIFMKTKKFHAEKKQKDKVIYSFSCFALVKSAKFCYNHNVIFNECLYSLKYTEVCVLASKKGTTKSTSKNSTSKKTDAHKEENLRLKEEIRGLKKQQNRENTLTYHLMPSVLLFSAVFLLICFVIPDKMGVLKYLTNFFVGLMSYGAYLVPVCITALAFFWRRDYKDANVYKRVILSCGFVFFFSAICRLWDGSVDESGVTFNPALLYERAADYGKGGGVIGGVIGGGIEKITGIGAWIVCIFACVLCGFAMFGITPFDIGAYIANKIRELYYNINEERKEKLQEAIAQQKAQDDDRIRQANEKSAQEEALDAKKMRKRRAYIEDDDAGKEEDGVFGQDMITPELSDDNAVPKRQIKENSDSLVNEVAFDDILRQNNLARQALSEFGNSEVQKELVDLDNIPDVIYENQAENAPPANAQQDFSSIFTDNASIAIAGVEAGAKAVSGDNAQNALLSERSSEISEGTPDEEKESVNITPSPTIAEVYNFPPINFLQKDPNPLTFAVTEELKQTSVKLVETLRNFGVKTKIMNICCGPTVTRYELQPEIGVRVRSIANLSDDIALHLAAAGVRIEAPIPGKDTVGIEIPNKTVSTVYLRNLIENSTFESQKSKLTVGLGMDVAGTPVYMNIAKMPHLLIAGATGMGKSVCINSFIVSLLYKARPDEVKLILIDPKKVELSIYNGLPHLLVPVVSDPKKAAGSLAWAVNEMERRFLLIEEVGVRDVDTYNEVTSQDPEREYLPKIVIIIDELADLMMTARVEVETSICRIAQKARAAGMHLVIGTQRPSVDVITGLIKANVPSRIACTVASQIDSRTIIDVSGAEKLLGRGDMLYAPVGSMKPIRVQGSFVSEKEIENIVSFLKNGYTVEYDNDIIESIEREAAKCGEKKKGKGSSGMGADEYTGEDKATILSSDDAIFPAIEIAVESGQVSTSLLQRKLSLGYSRAARIVDKLEKLGVVGPFEGSKPRKVLITYEEYLEMRMNYEAGDAE